MRQFYTIDIFVTEGSGDDSYDSVYEQSIDQGLNGAAETEVKFFLFIVALIIAMYIRHQAYHSN